MECRSSLYHVPGEAAFGRLEFEVFRLPLIEQIIDEFLRVGRRVHRLADIWGLIPGCQEIEVT